MNTNSQKSLTMFCRQVRARSYEHAEAIHLLHGGGVTSQVISILRQELDSLVRVMYLLSITDIDYRNILIQASANGQQWKSSDGRKKITDRDMVDLSTSMSGYGWTSLVYKFGCAFIHLSNMHDYNDRDPLSQLPASEKADILLYMNNYHGGPKEPDPKMRHLIPYLPQVFRKIAGNLECYVQTLESNGSL